MLGGCVIHDVEDGMTPVAHCASPERVSRDTDPAELNLDEDTWQVVTDKVYSPVWHELGFSPDGNHLVMMDE